MSLPPNVIRVVVDGEPFSDWLEYSFDSDLLLPADAFSFSTPNRKRADGKWPAELITPGAKVTATLDGVPQFVGYIDEAEVETLDEEVVRFTGRDLFGQLVDNSATPGSIKGLDLKKLAEKLTSSWVTTWVVEGSGAKADLLGARSRHAFLAAHAQAVAKVGGADPKITKLLADKVSKAAANLAAIEKQTFPRVKIEPGETPLQVLQRLAHRAGMLLWCNAKGEGVIAKPDYTTGPFYALHNYPPGDARAKLNNMIGPKLRNSHRDRYATITMLGSSGNTAAAAAASSAWKTSATDSEIKLSRLLYATDSDHKDAASLKAKAEREVGRRAFEGKTLTTRVQGHYVDGWPVQVDTQADVHWPSVAGDGNWYVVQRRMFLDSSGRFTDLTLRPPKKLLP